MPAPIKPEIAIAYMLSRGIRPLGPYTYARDPWECVCESCGHNFKTTYDSVKQNRGCPACANKIRGAKASLAKRLDTETVVKRLGEGRLELVGPYAGSKKLSSLRCLVCAFEFDKKVRFEKGKSILCPSCKKTTGADAVDSQLRNMAKSEGLLRFSGTYETLASIFESECGLGHRDKASVRQITRRGYVCSVCAAATRQVRTDVWSNFEAVSRALSDVGLQLKSAPHGLSSTVSVGCSKCGTEFSGKLSMLVRAQRVCMCTRARAKTERHATKADANRELILEKVTRLKGRLLSDVPALGKERINLACEIGHEWSTSVYSVLNLDSWCPTCAGVTPLGIQAIEKVVAARAGELLSNEYNGVDAIYEFKCNLGHVFRNRFSKVKLGQWCPTCSKSGKSEEIARTTFEQLFDQSFPKTRPNWLRNERGYQMEFDGLCEALGIAFEYQGRQHFEDIGIYSNDVAKRIRDDERKARLAAENGVTLIILTADDEYADFPRIIEQQLIASGADLSKVNMKRPVKIELAYIRNDRTSEFRELLASKNIELLSPKWISTAYSYELRCTRCGHFWRAKGNSFFNSRGATGCKKCAMVANHAKQRHSLMELQDFASKHKGSVISTEYFGRSHKYLFKCSEGHTFEGNFNNMKQRDQFCPECEGRQLRRYFSEDLLKQEIQKYGVLVLGQPNRIRSKTDVACSSCGAANQVSLEELERGVAPCVKCIE